MYNTTDKTVEQMFQAIETHHRGKASVPSLGLSHLRHMMNKLGTDAFTHALVKGCFEHGYEVKVVKNEVTIFSSEMRYKAFYANLGKQKQALEIHFNGKDPRFPYVKPLFENEEIERGYWSFNLRSPAEVSNFFEAVRRIEKQAV